LRSFEYVVPKTIKEAVSLLQESGAAVLAGGTDLLLRMKGREYGPRIVVDIKQIRGFDELRTTPKGDLVIGPVVTMRQIERAEEVRRDYQAVAQGAEVVGSVQIRNRATLVGNVCNAAPSADTSPGLLVLGARVRIAGPAGRRSLGLDNFFVGPGQTPLERGELVTGVVLPTVGSRTGSAYVRHTTRGAMDIAAVGVGVALTLADDGKVCEEMAIALGAVAPTPMRASAAEGMVRGQALTPKLVAAVAEKAADEARPISDVRASAGFRRELVRVLTGRMIETALENARQRAAAQRRMA
jgi:aerobic carbon-monoxide dehydrogenase medium subunit